MIPLTPATDCQLERRLYDVNTFLKLADRKPILSLVPQTPQSLANRNAIIPSGSTSSAVSTSEYLSVPRHTGQVFDDTPSVPSGAFTETGGSSSSTGTKKLSKIEGLTALVQTGEVQYFEDITNPSSPEDHDTSTWTSSSWCFRYCSELQNSTGSSS